MDLRGKRLLVMGGAGLIGSHLVDQLTETDVAEVVVYDNLFRGRRENLREALKDPRVSIFPHGGDVQQSDILERAMEGVDGVFHLAALWLLQCHEYPRAAFDVNIRGTFNVIEAAIKQGVKRVVYSSSASVYGDAVELPMTEEHPYNNETFYGATKIAGEHMFKALGHRYGLDWVGLRYMNVYGPRQDYKGAYIAVMMKILDRIDQGLPPVVYGDGSQQYDFIYVGDIARANICAMQAEVTGQELQRRPRDRHLDQGVDRAAAAPDRERPADRVSPGRPDVRHQPHRLHRGGRARPRLPLAGRPRRGDAPADRVATR